MSGVGQCEPVGPLHLGDTAAGNRLPDERVTVVLERAVPVVEEEARRVAVLHRPDDHGRCGVATQHGDRLVVAVARRRATGDRVDRGRLGGDAVRSQREATAGREVVAGLVEVGLVVPDRRDTGLRAVPHLRRGVGTERERRRQHPAVSFAADAPDRGPAHGPVTWVVALRIRDVLVETDLHEVGLTAVGVADQGVLEDVGVDLVELDHRGDDLEVGLARHDTSLDAVAVDRLAQGRVVGASRDEATAEDERCGQDTGVVADQPCDVEGRQGRSRRVHRDDLLVLHVGIGISRAVHAHGVPTLDGRLALGSQQLQLCRPGRADRRQEADEQGSGEQDRCEAAGGHRRSGDGRADGLQWS